MSYDIYLMNARVGCVNSMLVLGILHFTGSHEVGKCYFKSFYWLRRAMKRNSDEAEGIYTTFSHIYLMERG